MTPADRAITAGLGVLLLCGSLVAAVTINQRDEAREQATYAAQRRTEAERQAEYYRQLANTWEKLSGSNESLVRANALRAVSCERLMKVEVDK